MTAITYRESLAGYVDFGADDWNEGWIAGREVGSGLLRHLVLWGDGERVVPYLVPGFDVASGRAPEDPRARADLS